MTSFALGAMICGGKSSRMGREKAFLPYAGEPQIARLSALLGRTCRRRVAVCRAAQADAFAPFAPEGVIPDEPAGEGVLAAFRVALRFARKTLPGEAVLLVGCDLPLLDDQALAELAAQHARRPHGLAVTCFLDAAGRQPEPLASVWTPSEDVELALDGALGKGVRCPRKFLAGIGFHGVVARDVVWTFNANTPEEAVLAEALLARRSATAPAADSLPEREVEVRYFAQLREAAGRSGEVARTRAPDALALYLELQRARGLPLSPQLLRVALNDRFAPWDEPLRAGDRVAFIPPVSGG